MPDDDDGMTDEGAQMRAVLQEMQPDDIAFFRRILEIHESQNDEVPRNLIVPVDVGDGVVTMGFDDRTARELLQAIRELEG